MKNDMTAGDDYLAPCPSCGFNMDIGRITRANNLIPGHVDVCSECEQKFSVVKIDYIPVVWLRKEG